MLRGQRFLSQRGWSTEDRFWIGTSSTSIRRKSKGNIWTYRTSVNTDNVWEMGGLEPILTTRWGGGYTSSSDKEKSNHGKKMNSCREEVIIQTAEKTVEVEV